MKKFDVKSQAVIMCGISGSGKTHHARQLVKDGFVRLSADALIWEKAGAGLVSLSYDQQMQVFKECRTEILGRLSNLLYSGEKVVVDATNCKRAIRDEIRYLCSQVNVKPVFVFCQAEKEELLHRLSQRKGTGPDDLLVSREQLFEYWEGFERPQDNEKDFIFLQSIPMTH